MSKSSSDLFKKAILVAIGATAVTMEKVNSVIDELVEKGEMSEQQAKSFKSEVKEKAIAEKEAFEKKISDTIQNSISKVLKDMGVATVKDLDSLEARLNARIINEQTPTEKKHEENCGCEDCVK